MSQNLALENGSGDDPSSIGYELLLSHLPWIEISRIAWVLDDFFPPEKVKRWVYSPLSLLKLAILQDKKRISYRALVSTLTAEECEAIGLKEIVPGQFRIPCASTVHDFVRNRLGFDGYETIMLTIGKMVCKHIGGATGILDSTPIEAGPHDRFAEFNPHYERKMYKLHIFHYGPFPLVAIFSNGLAYDGHFASDLADKVLPMDPILKKLLADGGYDSFDVHAYLWYKFKIIPLIAFRENAVFNLEGTEMRINHHVNKKWKEGGDVHSPLEKKLEFLCEHGQEDPVGAYVRNQNLLNQKFEKECEERGDCERTHAHMKVTCDFSVKGIRNESKKLYMIKRFVSYQFILFTNIMRGMLNIHQSACYT
jgi:hypothetical protein